MTKYDIIRLVLNGFELLAFIAGLIVFKSLKQSYWKWFVFYLGLIVVAEFSSEYLLIVERKSNQWIYTWIVIPIEFIFFIWLYYKYFQSSRFQIWVQSFGLMYILAFVADMAWLRNLQFAFSSLSYLIGSIFILLLIMFYFLRLIKDEKVLTFKKDMMFWVSTGLLVFFLGSLPFYGLWNTLMTKVPKIFNLYWMVQMFFNCLMYLFFAFAFLWGKPK